MDIKVQKGLECVVKLLLKTKSDPYLQDKVILSLKIICMSIYFGHHEHRY